MTLHIHYDNKTQSGKQWAKQYKIPYATFLIRLKRGWSIKKALTMPVSSGCLNYRGQKLSYRQAAKLAGITKSAMQYRITKMGMSINEAIETGRHCQR